MEENALFISEPLQETETAAEQVTEMTIESFELGQFASLGMVAGGSAIVVSLLILGVLSILRTR